ncbi:MAG: TPM domain-containing protein [Betaproteobacteria bacterium]
MAKARIDKKPGGVPAIIWWWLGWVVFWIAVSMLPRDKVQPPSAAGKEPAQSLALTAYVSDFTGQLDKSAVARITESLAQFEKATSNQVVVAVYPQLPDVPAEEFTMQVAEQSRLGRQGLDNGAILSVFSREKVARLEVGYGLESVLTDAQSHRILGEALAPEWNAGHRDQAIERTVDRIESLVRDTYQAQMAPNRAYVLYRQMRVEIPKLMQGFLPMLVAVPIEGRIAVAFFGTLILMGMWDGLVQTRRLLGNSVLALRNLRSGKKLSASWQPVAAGSAIDSVKVLLFIGVLAASAVALVVVAGNGAFGGAGAMIRM